MTPEQMKELAEKAIPIAPPDWMNGTETKVYNMEIEFARTVFIHGLETGLNMDRWIPCSERLPTKEDLSEQGEVIIYSTSIGVYTASGSFRFEPDETHWQPLPSPPKTDKP